jgi:hypothetical protein
MTSYLIDKLEALKEDENNIKEKQRVLHEQIELEIEKKRRLELDGTITKLITQVEEIGKNIEGEIMEDNYTLIMEQETMNFQRDCEMLKKKQKEGLIDDQQYEEKARSLRERKKKDGIKYNEWRIKSVGSVGWVKTKITLEKFKDNLSKVGDEVKERCNNRCHLSPGLMKIPYNIKIYDEIMPIFVTMIGIMKKQRFEIDTLKSKVDSLLQ